jgi:hypothetical protein
VEAVAWRAKREEILNPFVFPFSVGQKLFPYKIIQDLTIERVSFTITNQVLLTQRKKNRCKKLFHSLIVRQVALAFEIRIQRSSSRKISFIKIG